MQTVACLTRFFVVARGKFCLSGTRRRPVRIAPKCVRVLSRDAIVSVMLLKSNSRSVRQVERHLFGRAPDEGARLH